MVLSAEVGVSSCFSSFFTFSSFRDLRVSSCTSPWRANWTCRLVAWRNVPRGGWWCRSSSGWGWRFLLVMVDILQQAYIPFPYIDIYRQISNISHSKSNMMKISFCHISFSGHQNKFYACMPWQQRSRVSYVICKNCSDWLIRIWISWSQHKSALAKF